jgi:hypothetical protein
MSNGQEDVHLLLLLEQIGKQLAAVETRLENAASLNGGFDILCDKVDNLQKDFEVMKTAFMGDGATQVGAFQRIRELEAQGEERKRFLATVVEPSLAQHQRLVFQMEAVQAIVKGEEAQKQEIVLLKERVAILNKIMWLFGTGLGGVLCKSLYDMVVGS